MIRKASLESLILLALTLENDIFDEDHLSFKEWHTIERDLRIYGFDSPVELLSHSMNYLKQRMSLNEALTVKISNRLQEIDKLIVLLEKYSNENINILTKYDREFPVYLTKRSRDKSSLYLYVTGSIRNLERGIRLSGLANVSKNEVELIEKIVDKIKYENKSYITLGEPGVDQIGLDYALEQEVDVILVVFKDYFENMSKYKKQIKRKKLTIVSQFQPGIKYNPTNEIVGDAFSSKMADFRIVVSCRVNSGLTWFNAIQNMTHHWTRVLILENNCLGNERLANFDNVMLYQGDLNSNHSFEYMFEQNRKLSAEEVKEFTQMTIFDFIPGGDEDEEY